MYYLVDINCLINVDAFKIIDYYNKPMVVIGVAILQQNLWAQKCMVFNKALVWRQNTATFSLKHLQIHDKQFKSLDFHSKWILKHQININLHRCIYEANFIGYSLKIIHYRKLDFKHWLANTNGRQWSKIINQYHPIDISQQPTKHNLSTLDKNLSLITASSEPLKMNRLCVCRLNWVQKF